MDEKIIKESFARAKQDIADLKEGFFALKEELELINSSLEAFQSSIKVQSQKPTIQHINMTDNLIDSNTKSNNQITPVRKLPFKGLKSPFMNASIGNEGVPTDRQTNQQTDNLKEDKSLEELSRLLESFTNLKEDIRNRFRSFTKQELLVFITIYQLENEKVTVDYPILAQKLALSESSIRDYTQKLIKKQAPLIKIKEKNKKIYLKIPEDFKKIASLQSLLSLKTL